MPAKSKKLTKKEKEARAATRKRNATAKKRCEQACSNLKSGKFTKATFVSASGKKKQTVHAPKAPASQKPASKKSASKKSASKKSTVSKNPWLKHVAKYRDKHPKLSYKECLQKAMKTYKKK